ncbi:MAG: ATP-binding protein [Sumerlaeia bacterium]
MTQDTPPKSKSLNPFRKAREATQRMNFRIKTMMIGAVTFIVTGLVVVVVGAILVQQMKNHLVEVAREEAKLLSEEVARDVQRVMETRHAQGLPDVVRDPEVVAHLKILSREGGVVLAAVLNANGDVLYQQFSDRQMMEMCPVRPGQEAEGNVHGTEGFRWELEVRDMPEGTESIKVPIRHGGEIAGYLEYGHSPRLALGRLDPISSAISHSLFLMVTLVLLCLGAAVLLLLRANCRHLRLQERHQEAERMAEIGTLASSLAHEIRNPLHAMNLHLDAAREELEMPCGSGTQKETALIVGRVQKQILNLNAIVSNFMNYALPGRIEKEPLRLCAMLSDVAAFLEPEFESRGVALKRDIPPDTWIEADPTAIRQILLNILLNGAQAMEACAECHQRDLTVRAESAHGGRRWRIHIEDTGPGLPSGKEEEIFQVFVSHRKGGSGFGLAIARRMIEDHGGTIHAATRPEGGARFTIELAAAKPAPSPATKKPAAAAVVWD